MSAAGELEALALRQWGEPTVRTRREWRWGSKGSLSLVISGSKRGLWHDHESGQGGRLDRPESVRTVRSREVIRTRDDARRIERARRLWEASEPLPATLGERYLIETRGIECPPGGWPNAVRYHRDGRALILAATLADGTLQAVHLVRLTPDAQNARRQDGSKSKIKLTFGTLSSAMVRLPGSADGPLVAEGPETGLALWTATGRETAIALGSLAKLTPPDGRRVVICRDDDPPDAPASRSLAEALERWRGQGLESAVATPWPSPRGDRSDFNDVLRQAGPEAVRARIHSALLDAIGLAPADPPAELPAATLADAHAYVARIAARFFTPRPEGELAPQVLLAGQGGIGKTDAAARFLPHGIVQAKAAGKPHRAIVLVSEFKVLGPQLVERFRALGLDVALLRGRGDAFDPKPDDLCKNPAAVAEALRAKQDIRQSVCGTPNGPHCPFLANCEHVAAVERASRADVVVAAHNFIFHRLSKRVWHDVGFVLIDEDFTTHGDRIFSLTMETFTKPGLDRFPVRYEGHPAAAMTASLTRLHQALHQACEASQDGYLTAEVLRAAGMTPADCLEARRLEWRREVPVTMTPGMELERRRELARDAAINIQLPQIAAVWDAVHAILTDGENGAGRIEITTDDDRRGMRRELTVHTQHQVATWLTDRPVLMLNATASLGDVRRFFPRTVERRPPAVAAPHASARLIVGGFSNRTLKNSKSKRKALKTWLALKARGRAETGLVTHKATLADLSGVPGMRALHHGANAGDDSMRTVDALAVVDGIRPPALDVAKLAAARTGQAITDRSRVETMAPVLMRDGRGVAVPVLAYADPVMQAAYAAIHNASVTQAAGRARAVMRTEDNPVEINIFGRVAPAGVVFDEIVRWQDIKPDRLEDMILADRIQLNAVTMTRLHPDLFSTEKAAERARERFGDVWQRLHGWLSQDRRPWARVRWQKPGKGCRLEWSLCPASDVAAMRAEIEGAFGEPVHWRVEVFTPGPGRQEQTPASAYRLQTEPGTCSAPAPVWVPGSMPALVGDEPRLPDS